MKMSLWHTYWIFLGCSDLTWPIFSRRYHLQEFSNCRRCLFNWLPDLILDGCPVQFKSLGVLIWFGGSFQMEERQSRRKWPYSPHLKQGWQRGQRHPIFGFWNSRTGERVLILMIVSVWVVKRACLLPSGTKPVHVISHPLKSMSHVPCLRVWQSTWWSWSSIRSCDSGISESR